ncbi:hypothetical protein Tco_0647416 [Tanacetum coccineum]
MSLTKRFDWIVLQSDLTEKEPDSSKDQDQLSSQDMSRASPLIRQDREESSSNVRPLGLGFPEFYKELEAEILVEGAQLMGLHFIQLELRLRKTPSKSFRPVKSAESLWQFWVSSSFGVSLAHDGSWSKWEPSLWLCG